MDIDSGKTLGDSGYRRPRLRARPALGRRFAADGRANTSTVIDLKALKPLGTVTAGGNPDATFDRRPIKRSTRSMGPETATGFRCLNRPESGGRLSSVGRPEAAVEDPAPDS